MALTLGGLVKNLNDKLGLTTDETVTTLALDIKSMLRWNSMQGRWRCLHTSTPTDLKSGDSSIEKPADFNQLDAIRLNDGTYNKEPLLRLEGGYQQWLTNRDDETSNNYDEPTHYCERGNYFYIDPVADGDYTATVFYWKIHSTESIADATELDFPDVFELPLTYALMAVYLDGKGRHDEAVYFYAQAEAKLDELRDGYEDKIDMTIRYEDI
jgi:hypothetical protein